MTQDVKHSPLPWAVRPQPYDDWGLIRASNGSVSCLARSPLYFNEDALGVHRKNKTDPTEANAQFIVTACNSHYELVEALERLCMVQEGVPMTGIQATQYLKDARNALAKVNP